MNTKAKVLGGFILGSVAGVTAGMLLAPRSGRKTRKKLINKSKEMANDIADTANAKMREAVKAYNQRVDKFKANGKTAVDELSGVAQ
ncbi:MAG TPA: YtxH domain-containing protein [Cyclobacteriaceae bacterium]|nr:YtxH domain-containing protein [Cyclobacteriaceae bacterium]